MSKELDLPVTEFSQFISAAGKWLSGTDEAKHSKLELRFGQHEGKLHLSVGGDSSFIECVLDTDATAIEQPFFLDLQYLTKFDYKVKKLVLVVPGNPTAQETKRSEERRAQFKSPGLNFRIPIKTGDAWNRNASDIGKVSHDASGLQLDAGFFDTIEATLKLPDSFKANKEPTVTIESPEEGKFHAFEYDFGAFWHQFTHPSIKHLNGFARAVIRYRFFLPFDVMKDSVSGIEFQQTERQTFGKIQLKEGSRFLKLRWTEPNSTKVREHIPTAVTRERQKVGGYLVFSAPDFLANVQRVLSFHDDADARADAIQFSILKEQTQYTLDNRNEEARILVEGQVLEPSATTLRVLLQGKCMKDYLKFFTLDAPIGMEVCQSSIILFQQDPKQGIEYLYWVPIQERP